MVYTAIYRCRRCQQTFTVEVGDNALLLMQVAIHQCNPNPILNVLKPEPAAPEGFIPTGIGDLIGADEEIV